jgi:two-component system, OmpR family, phosphate regulon sensor histidine kinase PhoR
MAACALIVVAVAVLLAVVLDQGRLGGVRLVVALGAGLAALVGVGAVWLVAKGATGPIRRITAEVERMSRGDLTARVEPSEGEELGPLAETLNRMADRLGARIEAVDRDREQLQQILGTMEEGVVLTGDGEGVRFANPAARRMLGATPETLRTLTPASLRILVEEVLATKGPAEREIETGLPIRNVLATGIPLREAGGVLVVLRDVTAARRVEAMRRDFVADASHELKTPVAAIQAAAETLERALRDDPEAAARFAGQLRGESARLSRLVSDLLDLSRLESERPVFEPVRFDLLAREEAARLDDSAREAGVTLEIAARPLTVSGSTKDLALLVGNLLENAVRYTPSGGRVRLEVGSEDGGVLLFVEDTGIGISSRDLPRIFERFYRVDRARSRATGGTGLGLSIARHVAEQHGGRIEAVSELGRGSTFQVWLPLHEGGDAINRLPEDHPRRA